MKQLIYGGISLLCFLNAGAQNIDSTLAIYAKDYGQEKMYLQYDKSSYAPGETVWFKDYLLKGIFPDDESKTVYIDWIGENGNILLHSVCAVENASTFGQFEIPVNYTGQFIHVRAYTKWMLNFDTSFLYNHDLKILADEKKSSAKRKLITELHFFPEGGAENGPGLYLNEMATSYDMISNIPVANVAYIKVFRPGFVGAPGSGTGGAIVIYTKIGKDGEPISILKGLDKNHVNGYTVVREFYSPDYDSIATDDKKDLRTTLYWNPTVLTSPGQNKVNLTFFNNDFTDEYRVIIEGMTNDGRLTHIEKIVK
jgi:hypothetical protein